MIIIQSRKELEMYFLISFLISLGIVGMFFVGCAKEPIYKIQTKEVLIPIKCDIKIPDKPKEDGSFESHRELAVYYKKVEQIAKDCTGGEK